MGVACVETVLLILIGIFIGLVVLSTGGGGGAIYLGTLTALFGLAPGAAAATSLVTSLPALLVGCFGYLRRHQVDLKMGNRMLLAALPAVIIGTLLSPHIPTHIYSSVIGIILMLLGLQMLWQMRGAQKDRSASKWLPYAYGAMSGLMVGIAGLSGGGPVMAGLLAMGATMLNAASTASYVVTGMAILGAIMHTSGGVVDWGAGIPLAIGAIIGAALAPTIMSRFAHGKVAIGLKIFIGLMVLCLGFLTLIGK